MDANKLLGTASLFDSEFSIDWLLELTNMKATRILEVMSTNLNTGVLFETQPGWFRFRDSKQKKKLRRNMTAPEIAEVHRQIITTLTREWQHDEKSLDILSGYLLKVPNDIDGCRWLMKASRFYVDRAMHRESVECLVKALDDLQGQDGKEAHLLYLDAAGHYFRSALARGESHWSRDVLEEAIRRSEILEDKAHQAMMCMYMAGYQWQNANINAFHDYFAEAKILAKQVTKPRYVRALESFCVVYYTWQGLNREAVEVYEKIEENIDNLPDGYQLLYASTMAAWSYVAVGKLNQGLGMLDAICSHALKSNRPDNFAFAVYYIAEALYSVGRTEDVDQFLTNLNVEQNEQFDPRIRQDIVLLHSLVHFEKGDIEKARSGLSLYLKRLSSYRAVPYSSYEFLLRFCWAIEQGEHPRIKGLKLKDVIESGYLKLNYHFEALAYRYQALVDRKKGVPVEEVLSTLLQSLAAAEKTGYLLAIADTKIEMARVYLEAGDFEKAQKVARQAAKTILSYKQRSFPADLSFLVRDLSTTDNLLSEILNLAQSISTIHNSDDIIRQIISTVIQITGAERGAIFLIREGENDVDIRLEAAKNLSVEDISHPGFRESMALIRKTAASKQGSIRKLNLDRSITHHSYYNIRSCACIPMIVKNQVVGVFYFDNHFLASGFRRKDLKLFSFFASQAAIAIDNAEAYGEVKRLNLKLDKENQYYREQQLNSLHFKNFIGESNAIKKVLGKIEKVAHTDTNVLITGETGVGKELVAGTIMDNSGRADQPFIRVNCNAFSENLIASELFGHEKGSFTGADRQRAGRFELANNGTLFLDEIGDIPHNVQVRLLRVLQTQEFERIGGTQTLKSNFRLIAATNQDLGKLVKNGAFREDLFFRLNVFPVHVPPLRERKEDIPPLAHFFLREYAKKLNRPFSKILDREMQKMLAYTWPGNVRELQNVIERGVILSTGVEFRVPDLKTDTSQGQAAFNGISLAEMERNHILAALENTAGKISGPGGAAESLGLHHNTLRSKMNKLGIRRQTAHQ